MDYLLQFLQAFAALLPEVAGAGALIGAIVSVIKLWNKIAPVFGLDKFLIPDGYAGWISLIVHIVLWVLALFIDVPVLTQVLGEISGVLLAVVSFVTSMLSAKVFHLVLKFLGIKFSLGNGEVAVPQG